MWLIWPSRKLTGPLGMVEAETELDAEYEFFKRNPIYAMMGSIEMERIA